jgi:hypothetical protein
MLLGLAALLQATTVAPPQHHCVGEPLASCLTRIRSGLEFDQDEVDHQLARFKAVDVNGHPIAKSRYLLIMANPPGTGTINAQLITVKLGSGDVVQSVSVTLPHDSAYANTEEEYDETWLFPMASVVLDPACVGGKVALYRVFQNSIKPKIVRGGKETRITATHAEASRLDKAPPVAICGVTMSYSNLSSVDSARVDADNPHGTSSLISLDFN